MAEILSPACAQPEPAATFRKQGIAHTVRARLEQQRQPYAAHDNIASAIHSETELRLLQQGVEQAVDGLLEALVIDTRRDPNTMETARRMAKMYVQEVFSGRYQPAPKVADFPAGPGAQDVHTLGPITVRSACSHHLVPIIGQLWVGVLPAERVLGISKFARLADWVLSRPRAVR